MPYAPAPVRLRGKIGQAQKIQDVENENIIGKWFFEIEVWNVAGTERVGAPIGPFGPWESQKEAEKQLEKAIKLGANAIIQAHAGQDCEKGYDMLDGGKLKKMSDICDA